MLKLADAVEEDFVAEGLVEEDARFPLLQKCEHLVQILQYGHLHRLLGLEKEHDKELE